MSQSFFDSWRAMIASVHFATGAASALLAQKLLSKRYDWNYDLGKRYMLGFAAGIFSHLVFDAVPHAEYSLEGEALLSLLFVEAALVMVFLLDVRNPAMSQLLAWGYIGGALPDIMGMAGRKLGWAVLAWPYEILHITHDIAEPLFASFWMQAVIVVMCIAYVRIKSA